MASKIQGLLKVFKSNFSSFVFLVVTLVLFVVKADHKGTKGFLRLTHVLLII